MDAGDLIVPAVLIGGGYLAYRSYQQNKATPTAGAATGNAAADMTPMAARTTNFSPAVRTRMLFRTATPPPLVPIISPHAAPQVATAAARAGGALAQKLAVIATGAPVTTAPAPSVQRWAGVGLPAVKATRPTGMGPEPGDPNPLLFTRGLGIA